MHDPLASDTLLPSRRAFIARLLGAVAVAPAIARADSWPVKPIRIVVPFASGGAPDILARLMAAEMGRGLGSAFVDNRGGAGGNVGADVVAKAPPDGYTLLLTTTATQSINPALYPSMPYDAAKDFSAVSLVANTPLMLVTAKDSPIASFADLIARAKAQPGTVTYASAGVGTMQHMVAELVDDRTGARMLHVPYKGTGPVMPDLLSRRVDVMFNSVAAVGNFVKEGRLRALAVTTPKRLPAWPNVPTIAESGVPGFEASAWYALFGPARLPREIVARLNAELARIVALPAVRDRYAELGLEPAHSTPEELDALVRRDLETWTRIIKAKGIKSP
ncbi:MAG TPA: tripartite tricarboxylate transporter substrate binding protein [Caldimonas sp.]|nr:tripartite tricarboxylate transporter substrate binding protein [Caldimonas sp.]